jgi:hypothetical protein
VRAVGHADLALPREDEEQLLVDVVEVVRERLLPRGDLGEVVAELLRAEVERDRRVLRRELSLPPVNSWMFAMYLLLMVPSEKAKRCQAP